MNCDDCGKPCGDGAVPVINDAHFIVGYQCRHCAESPPALCWEGDCTTPATEVWHGRDYCPAHHRQQRRSWLYRTYGYKHLIDGGT